MATKARHLKTPVQLWIIDNRKRLGLEPADLAALTGVSEATVRGWESRGRPSEDALLLLEHRFGVPVPRGEQAGAGGDVAAAIDRQTAVIERFLTALQTSRVEQSAQMEALAELFATREAMRAESALERGDELPLDRVKVR